MEHIAKMKSYAKTEGGGIAFSVLCCGEYEETWHIEHAGMYSKEELQRKIDDGVTKTREHHENHCAALDMFAQIAEQQ